MDGVKQSTQELASGYVRLTTDYTTTDDVMLRCGELCAVLGRHDDQWLLVARSSDNRRVYVPIQCVECSRFEREHDHGSRTVVRSSTMVSPSSPYVSSSTDVVRSLSLRSRKNSPSLLTTSVSQDWADPPTPAPPSPPSPPPPFDGELSGDDSVMKPNVNRIGTSLQYHGNTVPRTTSPRVPSRPIVVQKQTSEVGIQCDDQNDFPYKRHTQQQQQQQQSIVDDSVIYANWEEIQKLKNSPTVTPASEHLVSCETDTLHVTMTSVGGASRLSFGSKLKDQHADSVSRTPVTLLHFARLDVDAAPTSPPAAAADNRNDDSFNVTLLNKKGSLLCLPIRDNGKSIGTTQWTTMYVVLHGALVSFYRDEDAAQPRSDGSMPMPMASLGLQGAVIHITTYDNPACDDAIRITTACNTQYALQANSVQETHSWCYHLKNNVAVLLAERTARMEHAKPVSTFSSSKQRDGASPMSKVAQRLKVLLVRRPTKEDLKDRGIYRESMFGSSLALICVNDKSKVPVFLTKCFQEIEFRGLSISGIYRLSGSVSKIQKLRIQASQGEYDVSECDDIHTITGVVKMFLRELAEPLIPFQFFDRFCDSYEKIHNPRDRQKAFIGLIQELPDEHHQTLNDLCTHLEKVSQNSAENQMTFHNLAIVFGPTLMWLPEHKTNNITSTLILQGQIIEYVLLEHRQLFGSPT